MLSCTVKSTGEYLSIEDYDDSTHHRNIVEKISGYDVFARPRHQQGFHKSDGSFVTKHFVLTSSYTCDNFDIEFDDEYFEGTTRKRGGESLNHKLGKIYVKKIILEAGYINPKSIEFEKLIKLQSGKRRIIDVAVEMTSGDFIAHEIQLSAITPEELKRRTEDYASLGIDVTWWLGEKSCTKINKDFILDYFHTHPPVLIFNETTEEVDEITWS